MSRLIEALRLVEKYVGEPTHPAGCVAFVGWDERPDGIAWVVRVNTCEHEHPDTQTALLQQYDAQGWTNLGEGR